MLKDVIGLFPLNPAIHVRSSHRDPYWDMVVLIGGSGNSVEMKVAHSLYMVLLNKLTTHSPRITSSED